MCLSWGKDGGKNYRIARNFHSQLSMREFYTVRVFYNIAISLQIDTLYIHLTLLSLWLLRLLPLTLPRSVSVKHCSALS